MFAKQISVFIENKTGRFAEILEVLTDMGVNMKAMSLSDTATFGVLRFIADEAEGLAAELKQRGLTASVTDVLIVKLKDEVGGLSKAISMLAKEGIGVEYAYAFLTCDRGYASVVLRCSDDEYAAKVLEYGFSGN